MYVYKCVYVSIYVIVLCECMFGNICVCEYVCGHVSIYGSASILYEYMCVSVSLRECVCVYMLKTK